MSSKRESLSSWLADSVIVADGAMGTLLQSRGIAAGQCLEEANLSRAETVFALHREYVHAGARILTSNTFHANRLAMSRFEMADRVRDINARGVEIARQAAHGGPVWVGASAGPLKVMLKPYGDMTEEEARDICREQIAALADPGPDLFVLETQQSVLETVFFIEACREIAPEIPILASLTFSSEEGRTFFGDTAVEGCRKLVESGADIVGINCSVGPAGTLPIVEQVAENVNAPLSVMPNAGYPTELDGKIVYLSSTDYVTSYIKRYLDLGVNVVGGCCGTTPETIRAVAELVNHRPPVRRQVNPQGRIVIDEPPPEPADPPHLHTNGRFFETLETQFSVTCEISPPRNPDARQAVETARLLKHAGAGAIDLADNPMAKVRVSSTALAHFIQQETGLPTILHMTCRDRNLLGLQSELLGASLLGVEAILALSGDPASIGDFPTATSVNDVNALGLVKIIKSLNEGRDFSDHPLGGMTRFAVGVGVNMTPSNWDKELNKLKERVDAGVDFVMSQPVFTLEAVERFLEKANSLPIKVLPGLLPLSTLKQALFLHHEVPGIVLPDNLIQRIESLETKEDQESYGVELARELLVGLRSLTPGAYLTSGGRRHEILERVLTAIQ
ncbi:MAG: bifunctional homocysteine S-methyltransferase/methylenetetrahydrofolate reductase [Acidobacteriota bacterium]